MPNLIHVPWLCWRSYWVQDISIYGGSFSLSSYILFISSRGLAFPSMIWFVAFAFLRCWALIFLTFITCFQWDDHLIILNVVVHVKSTLFLLSWHCQIPKLYYPLWFILMSPPLRNLWYICIFTYKLIWKTIYMTMNFHIFNRCSFRCHENTSLIICKPNCGV